MARRPNPPVIHMIVALLVVLAPALIAVAWFQRVPETPVTALDPAPIIAAASEAPYALAIPTNLPDGWVCTRARWTPVGQPDVGGSPAPGNTFALGYLTPARAYVAVDQRDTAPEPLVVAVTRTGVAEGTSLVGGRSWARYVSPDGRTRALVLRADDHVTIVSGDLGYEALEAFAGTLAFKNA